MLPVLVVGFSLSFSGSGSTLLDAASQGEIVDFQENCVDVMYIYDGKIEPADKAECKWKVDATEGYCVPFLKSKFKEPEKFKEVPFEAECLHESKDDKCPLKNGAKLQEPGGCSDYVYDDETNDKDTDLGTFYMWQDELPPTGTAVSTDGWISDRAQKTLNGNDISTFVPYETCQNMCKLNVPYLDRVEPSGDGRVPFGDPVNGIQLGACKCKFLNTPTTRYYVPCDMCTQHTLHETEMRHTPNFHAALGGSLGGLALALGYIVILSR